MMKKCLRLSQDADLSPPVIANAIALIMRSWYFDLADDLATVAIEMSCLVMGENIQPRQKRLLEKLAVELEGILLTPTIVTKGAAKDEVMWWIDNLMSGKYNLTPESLDEAHHDWLKK
jgi:hypothetical protein